MRSRQHGRKQLLGLYETWIRLGLAIDNFGQAIGRESVGMQRYKDASVGCHGRVSWSPIQIGNAERDLSFDPESDEALLLDHMLPGQQAA